MGNSLRHFKKVSAESIELLGELHPLLEQLGRADGMFTLEAAATSLQLGQVQDLAALKHFLRTYTAQMLVAIELPAIHQAYELASRNQCREIIALDAQLAVQPMLRDFASASRRVGQSWIKRLRPLRDQRLVQRYLHAVETGAAQGWHSIVYGITLSTYSVPAREGLLTYGSQTLRGFLYSASARLRLTHEQSQDVLHELTAGLPASLEKLLGNRVPARI